MVMRPDMMSQVARFGAIGVIIVGAAIAGGLMLRSATEWRGELEAALFDPPRTISEADDASRESGKDVLLFVQATWCPHCASYRKGAFRDEALLAYLRDNTEPALASLQSRSLDPDQIDQLERLRVNNVPTLVLRRNGRELGRLTGVYEADTIRRWVESEGSYEPGASERVSEDLR